MPLERICKFFVMRLWAFLADPNPGVLFLFARASKQSSLGIQQMTEQIFSKI